MDFNKFKEMAKAATEKSVEGISKANEIRKKASQETKITIPASNQFATPNLYAKLLMDNIILVYIQKLLNYLTLKTSNLMVRLSHKKLLQKGKQPNKAEPEAQLLAL